MNKIEYICCGITFTSEGMEKHKNRLIPCEAEKTAGNSMNESDRRLYLGFIFGFYDKRMQLADIYSSSHVVDGEYLINELKKINIDLKDFICVDACGNVGGTGFCLAKHSKFVNIYEYDKDIYRMLQTNFSILSERGISNYQLYNGDFSKDSQAFSCDLLFIDPPWGGPESVHDKTIIPFLYQNNDEKINIDDFIVEKYDILPKYTILKVPADNRVIDLLKIKIPNININNIPVERTYRNGIKKVVYNAVIIMKK